MISITGKVEAPNKKKLSPFHTLLTIATLIFFGELLVMFFLSYFPSISPVLGGFVDSTLLLLLLSPPLYLLLFRPLIRQITEQERTEEELTRHQHRLKDLVRERTKELKIVQEELLLKERLFTFTISHELRNPLGTIKNSLFSVAQRVCGKGLEVEDILDRVDRNIDRCNNTIEELLDYSRSYTPDMKTEATTIDDWLGDFLDKQDFPKGISIQRKLASGMNILLNRERFRRAAFCPALPWDKRQQRILP